MKILETNRLLLAHQTTDDAAFVHTLMNSPGWLLYIGDRGIKTVEDATRYIINGAIKSYQQHGFGLYAVRLKESGVPIGLCGFIKRPGLDHIDIGFAFLPEYTGSGYAYESAAAVMNYGREVLKIDTVVAITTRDNEASVKLLKKLGFSFKELVTLPGDSEILMLFEYKR